MPSKSLDSVLRDILHHIDLAANFSAGFDRASFTRDIKTVYAVTRCLEIISEASRRLPSPLCDRTMQVGHQQIAIRELREPIVICLVEQALLDGLAFDDLALEREVRGG